MPYTPREYALCMLCMIYGECRGNDSRDAVLYRERFSNTNAHPFYRVFIRVNNSYLEGKISVLEVAQGYCVVIKMKSLMKLMMIPH